VVSPHNSRNFLCPCPIGFLQPSFLTSEQNSVRRLDLPVRLGVFDWCKQLLYPQLYAQLAQLLACKLGAIIGQQLLWDPEAEYYVLPHKVLDLMGCDMRY